MGSRLHGNDGRRTHNRYPRDPGNPGQPHRHSRDGGNPRQGAGDGFPSARERRWAAAHPQSSFPRRRESTAGGGRWVPVCTGTTDGGGRTHNRHSRDGGNPRRRGRRWVPVCTGTTGGGGVPTIVIPAKAGIHGWGPAMGSRLHGNDGRRPAHPQSSFPRRRESTAGGRRWVPVCTGTTGGDRRTHSRHSHNSGNPRQPHRHSRDGGNPRRGPAMGSRLHGNDGRRRAHPQSSFPRRRENPRWGPAMGSRLHGNGGGRRQL